MPGAATPTAVGDYGRLCGAMPRTRARRSASPLRFSGLPRGRSVFDVRSPASCARGPERTRYEAFVRAVQSGRLDETPAADTVQFGTQVRAIGSMGQSFVSERRAAGAREGSSTRRSVTPESDRGGNEARRSRRRSARAGNDESRIRRTRWRLLAEQS